jgi:MoxR-like ATPase
VYAHIQIVHFEVQMITETARILRENVQKVIVGKDEPINLALVAVLCGGHILIEDVPGIGKTTLARTLAASLGCSFRRVQPEGPGVRVPPRADHEPGCARR